MTLTREEILNQPAGPELSEWVAVDVMGFDPGVVRHGGWSPSEDMSAAVEVMDKFRQNKDLVTLIGHKRGWECRIAAMVNVVYGVDVQDVSVESQSAPEAICKAALAVLNL